MGADELANGVALLRTMEGGNQEVFSLEEIVEQLLKRLGVTASRQDESGY
jgi:hypothetical protein